MVVSPPEAAEVAIVMVIVVVVVVVGVGVAAGLRLRRRCPVEFAEHVQVHVHIGVLAGRGGGIWGGAVVYIMGAAGALRSFVRGLECE